jgi:hypothetical protein
VSSQPAPLQLPCTTVEQAVRNLEQSLPVIEAIAGDAVLARPYWELARAMVRRLPLAYVALIPTEVMELDADTEAFAANIVAAMSGDLAAMPHLKALAEYNDEVPPYPLDVLYSASIGIDRWAPRTWNATVLDSGFVDFRYVSWNKSAESAAPVVPPVPEATFRRAARRARAGQWLGSAGGALRVGRGSRLMKGSPEQLFVQINAKSAADARQLESSTSLRGQLDALARDRLEPWCAKHGFGWEAFASGLPVEHDLAPRHRHRHARAARGLRDASGFPDEFATLQRAFLAEYEALRIPDFGPGYVQNLEAIGSAQALAERSRFFSEWRSRLSALSRGALDRAARPRYDTLPLRDRVQPGARPA